MSDFSHANRLASLAGATPHFPRQRLTPSEVLALHMSNDTKRNEWKTHLRAEKGCLGKALRNSGLVAKGVSVKMMQAYLRSLSAEDTTDMPASTEELYGTVDGFHQQSGMCAFVASVQDDISSRPANGYAQPQTANEITKSDWNDTLPIRTPQRLTPDFCSPALTLSAVDDSQDRAQLTYTNALTEGGENWGEWNREWLNVPHRGNAPSGEMASPQTRQLLYPMSNPELPLVPSLPASAYPTQASMDLPTHRYHPDASIATGQYPVYAMPPSDPAMALMHNAGGDMLTFLGSLQQHPGQLDTFGASESHSDFDPSPYLASIPSPALQLPTAVSYPAPHEAPSQYYDHHAVISREALFDNPLSSANQTACELSAGCLDDMQAFLNGQVLNTGTPGYFPPSADPNNVHNSSAFAVSDYQTPSDLDRAGYLHMEMFPSAEIGGSVSCQPHQPSRSPMKPKGVKRKSRPRKPAVDVARTMMSLRSWFAVSANVDKFVNHVRELGLTKTTPETLGLDETVTHGVINYYMNTEDPELKSRYIEACGGFIAGGHPVPADGQTSGSISQWGVLDGPGEYGGGWCTQAEFWPGHV